MFGQADNSEVSVSGLFGGTRPTNGSSEANQEWEGVFGRRTAPEMSEVADEVRGTSVDGSADSPDVSAAVAQPALARLVSQGGTQAFMELVSECICPISQQLMVDPVVASDGHTYDRAQIEAWIEAKQALQPAGGLFGQMQAGQVTSPQTREPLTDLRLLPNRALKRTIERLVSSGKLEAEVVKEWEASRSQIKTQAANALREKSEKRFPTNSEVSISCRFIPDPPTRSNRPTGSPARIPAETAGNTNGNSNGNNNSNNTNTNTGANNNNTNSASSSSVVGAERQAAASKLDFTVTIRFLETGSGGLFGSQEVLGRTLVERVPVVPTLLASQKLPDQVRSVMDLIERPITQPAPLAPEALVQQVLGKPRKNHSRDVKDIVEGAIQDEVLAVGHIIRRLATIPGGLPAAVQEEWINLDRELSQRRADACGEALRNVLKGANMILRAVVREIGDRGEFVLFFPDLPDWCATRQITVPADFTMHAVSPSESSHSDGEAGSSRSANNNRGGGLFGNYRRDAPRNQQAYDMDEFASETPREEELQTAAV